MMELNQKQKEAADFFRGIASVVAVPGSGKTLTMTHRIGKLVMKHKIPPENILGLTFTRNAAHAMRTKLKPVLDDLSSRVVLLTIHAFCHWLLKEEGRTFELLHGKEQIRFIRKIMKKLKVKNLPTGLILSEINLAKNNLIIGDEFRSIYQSDEFMLQIADIYEAYEREKQKCMLLDFNDLLIETYILLSQNEDIREKYQQMFKHILVDEFQDTNPAQMGILKLLTDLNGKDRSFWICGDDWQSIYAFAGSSLGNILNFSSMFPKSRQFILDMNYRSTPQILKVCQNLIERNNKRIDKTLSTINPDGDDVIILDATNEEDEAIQIANEVMDLTKRKDFKPSDIAILYRANSQSRLIEETFSSRNIPYHIENGLSFYQRFEVRVLLDYMKLIINPNSDEGDEALSRIINVPNRYIGRKFMNELEEFSNQQNLRLYQGLKQLPVKVPYLKKNVKEFIGLIDPLIADANTISPSDMVYMLRESLDYDKFISDEEIPGTDDSKIANVNQLQMAANKYNDVPSLLNYTDTFKSETRNDKNGVSLMTIHKSKGLEFQIVFVIGMIDGVLPNRFGDIEEERRIAFVGLSRAMKLLYVTYCNTYMGKSIKRSPFIDEMLAKGASNDQH